MKTDSKLLFVCLFVSALFANTNAVAGNWNSSRYVGITDLVQRFKAKQNEKENKDVQTCN